MQGHNSSSSAHCVPLVMENNGRHKEFSLVFFNTFEPISLTPDSCMQQKGVPMLYEQSRTVLPSLYVCPVENVLGRVPLIPCYFNGHTSNTIPYRYRGAIPAEAAVDSRPESGTCSRLFEINIWMRRYEERFHRRLLWQTLRLCGSSTFRNPGHRERPPSSVGVSRP